jgi:hypothetical protein
MLGQYVVQRPGLLARLPEAGARHEEEKVNAPI